MIEGAYPSSPFLMTSTPELEISGLVAGALRVDRARLAAYPPEAQVPDIGALVRGKKGRGVRLSALAGRAGLDPRARFVNIASIDPAFAVSVPIGEVLEQGVVLYEVDGAPIAPEKGGPFRLVVCGHSDECVHVKGLARLEFAAASGRDTRPKDDAEHRALHERARAAAANSTAPNSTAPTSTAPNSTPHTHPRGSKD